MKSELVIILLSLVVILVFVVKSFLVKMLWNCIVPENLQITLTKAMCALILIMIVFPHCNHLSYGKIKEMFSSIIVSKDTDNSKDTAGVNVKITGTSTSKSSKQSCLKKTLPFVR